MKFRMVSLIAIALIMFCSTVTAANNKTGLATITQEYHKLSVLLQQCSLIYPQASENYKRNFSAWLIRNRLALKKGELDSKRLSAKNGMRYEKSVLNFQLGLKKKYADPEQLKSDKTCGYLPSLMAE